MHFCSAHISMSAVHSCCSDFTMLIMATPPAVEPKPDRCLARAPSQRATLPSSEPRRYMLTTMKSWRVILCRLFKMFRSVHDGQINMRAVYRNLEQFGVNTTGVARGLLTREMESFKFGASCKCLSRCAKDVRYKDDIVHNSVIMDELHQILRLVMFNDNHRTILIS
jgi:hypothetical protein